MGRDKATLELDGRPLLDRTLAALEAVADRVRLATGGTERYLDRGVERVLDAPAHRGLGPVAGLAAGLAAARALGRPWVALLACDMPLVTGEPLVGLLGHAAARDLDACLFEHEGHLEPLLAVYHVRTLGPVRRALEAGRARMIDFHEGFGTLRVDGWGVVGRGPATRAGDVGGVAQEARVGSTAIGAGTGLGDVGSSWARNVNTPEDWRALVEGRGAPEGA